MIDPATIIWFNERMLKEIKKKAPVRKRELLRNMKYNKRDWLVRLLTVKECIDGLN